jgi:hypothetical protein
MNTKEALEVATRYLFGNGYCHALALAIQRLTGGVILMQTALEDEAEDEDDYYVEHVWVRLPDGRNVDIGGWMNPFLDEKNSEDVMIVDAATIRECMEYGKLRQFDADMEALAEKTARRILDL